LSSDLSLIIDIRHSVALIATYIGGLTQADFEADPLRRDATAFRLLLIGEAANHLSSDLKSKLPDIDWRGMVSLRHRLAHDYGSANFSVLWAIAGQDIPALSDALASL